MQPKNLTFPVDQGFDLEAYISNQYPKLILVQMIPGPHSEKHSSMSSTPSQPFIRSWMFVPLKFVCQNPNPQHDGIRKAIRSWRQSLHKQGQESYKRDLCPHVVERARDVFGISFIRLLTWHTWSMIVHAWILYPINTTKENHISTLISSLVTVPNTLPWT